MCVYLYIRTPTYGQYEFHQFVFITIGFQGRFSGNLGPYGVLDDRIAEDPPISEQFGWNSCFQQTQEPSARRSFPGEPLMRRTTCAVPDFTGCSPNGTGLLRLLHPQYWQSQRPAHIYYQSQELNTFDSESLMLLFS